jgi:hypothetical protein
MPIFDDAAILLKVFMSWTKLQSFGYWARKDAKISLCFKANAVLPFSVAVKIAMTCSFTFPSVKAGKEQPIPSLLNGSGLAMFNICASKSQCRSITGYFI